MVSSRLRMEWLFIVYILSSFLPSPPAAMTLFDAIPALFQQGQLQILTLSEEMLGRSSTLLDDFSEIVNNYQNASSNGKLQLKRGLKFLKQKARRMREDIEDEIEVEQERIAELQAASGEEAKTELKESKEKVSRLGEARSKLKEILATRKIKRFLSNIRHKLAESSPKHHHAVPSTTEVTSPSTTEVEEEKPRTKRCAGDEEEEEAEVASDEYQGQHKHHKDKRSHHHHHQQNNKNNKSSSVLHANSRKVNARPESDFDGKRTPSSSSSSSTTSTTTTVKPKTKDDSSKTKDIEIPPATKGLGDGFGRHM